MAIDKTAYTDKLIAIQKIKAQIDDLSKSRTADEQALNVAYKVNECNEAKRILSAQYQVQLESLYSQLKTLEIEINDIVMER